MTSPQPQDLALLHLKIKVKETTKEIVISTRNSPQDRRTTTETGKQTQTHSSPTNRENSATTTTTPTNHNNNTMINDSNGFRFRPYSEYTIYNLKEDYFTKELQEQKRIRLLYAGKELRDESFVKDCNLHDNAVLHAVITQYNPDSQWNNSNGVHGGSPNENNNIFEGFRRRDLGSGAAGGMNNNGNNRRNSRTTMNGNPSSNLQQRRIEGYIFFFLSFIFLFIIWWARYMYPEAFSKMSINILGVVTGIYILSLLHFIL